jgi:hypothetical protein
VNRDVFRALLAVLQLLLVALGWYLLARFHVI